MCLKFFSSEMQELVNPGKDYYLKYGSNCNLLAFSILLQFTDGYFNDNLQSTIGNNY